MVKNPPANAGDMDWEDPLEKDMATHSSILAWEIPRTEEPGRLWSMGSQKSETGLSNSNNNSKQWQLQCYTIELDSYKQSLQSARHKIFLS